MKKLLALVLVLALALPFFAIAEEKFDVVMVSDIGQIDDKSFNQGTWEGVEEYAKKNNKTYKYFMPTEKSVESYMSMIEQAVKAGAKIIVTPGFLFEEPIFMAQDMYPDVHFILIDGTPHDAEYKEFRTGENVVGITYAEQQAGFLAGYAAVKDGYTQLGFMGGMAVPAVVRFGYGFVEGANYAAKELGLKDVKVNYHYTGKFEATPEAKATAASWYKDGVQVIFACGGALGNSVMAAAKEQNGKVIGVDVDQSFESETVITSAMKGLRPAVVQMLTKFFNNEFPGGQNLVLDASKEGVSLPMNTSRFNKFSQADYDAIFAKLANNEIEISRDKTADGKDVTLADLAQSEIKLVEIK